MASEFGARSRGGATDAAIAHSAKAAGASRAGKWRPATGRSFKWAAISMAGCACATARTLFWIADATGHGASAALHDDVGKAAFPSRQQPNTIRRAKSWRRSINDFRSIFGARSFMTAMCVALDPATGRASVVGAGHPPLLVQRKNGKTETIFSSAPPLGLAAAEKISFDETEVELHAGRCVSSLH